MKFETKLKNIIKYLKKSKMIEIKDELISIISLFQIEVFGKFLELDVVILNDL